MRSPVEILKEQQKVSGQINSVNDEIREKEIDLERLKESNLELLTRNIAKSKRPASLRTQNEKLASLEVEITQLKAVSPRLEARKAQLKDELQIAKARQELESYYGKSEVFFGRIEEAMALLQGIVERTGELEEIIGEVRESSPLFQLSDIFGTLDSERQFNALGFPEDELGKYRFLNQLVELEKQVKRLPAIVKGLSDFAYGLEYLGIKSLRIPEGNQGVVSVGGGGPKTKILPAGPPEIETFPERYSEGDVRKYAAQMVNRK